MMHWLQTGWLAVGTVLVLAGAGGAAPAPREPAAGAVTTLTGSASVARAGLRQPASLGLRDDVFARDRISTARESLVRVLLGGRTTVTARELSVLTIAEGGGRARVGLDAGGVALDVAPVRTAGGRATEVRTPNAIAAVRGTVLAVETMRPAPGAPAGRREIVTTVHVLAGVVDVWAIRAPARRVTVSAGQVVEVIGDVVGRPRGLSATETRRVIAAFRLPRGSGEAPAVARDRAPDQPPGGVASVGIAGTGAPGSARPSAARGGGSPVGAGPGISGLTAAPSAAAAAPGSVTTLVPVPGIGAPPPTTMLPAPPAQPGGSGAPSGPGASGAPSVTTGVSPTQGGAPPVAATAGVPAPATPGATAGTAGAGPPAATSSGTSSTATSPATLPAATGPAVTGPAPIDSGGASLGAGAGGPAAGAPPPGTGGAGSGGKAGGTGLLGGGSAPINQSPVVTQPSIDSNRLIRTQPVVPK